MRNIDNFLIVEIRVEIEFIGHIYYKNAYQKYSKKLPDLNL